MARPTRSSMISPDDITIAHITTQTAQQMYLLGEDSGTGEDFSHRKDWIIDIMAHQSLFMAIDILRFAIMDNHVHFLLRTRPDIVRGWSDQEVARNYLQLCPRYNRRRKVDGKWVYEAREPRQCDIDEIVNDKNKLKKIRQKLSSLSFWMQLLKQKVARRSNLEVQKEGETKGAFWKGRFHMTVIHSREYLLACAVYIDLNPYRAKMTDSLEGYQYTSVYMQLVEVFGGMLERGDLSQADCGSLRRFPESVMLSPIEFIEQQNQQLPASEASASQDSESQLGVEESSSGDPGGQKPAGRCSDTGFLEITEEQYLELLTWCLEQRAADREGPVSGLEHAVVTSYGMSSWTWNDRLRRFSKLCRYEAGVSRRKLFEGVCGKSTAAMELALRDAENGLMARTGASEGQVPAGPQDYAI